MNLQTALRATNRKRAPFAWRQGTAYGALFGLAMAALESLAETPPGSPLAETSLFTARLAVMWGVCGVTLACTAQVIAGRLRARWVAVVFVAEAALLSFAWAWAGGQDAVRTFVAPAHSLGMSMPSGTSFAYNVWILLVYGGAFFGFCLIGSRMARARDVLARAEIERSRTAALLNEAQFEALKGRVEPATLLRSISVLRERYTSRREEAEALLDAFVAFLRQAMPAVRSGRSSLAAEVALLRAYAQLLCQLEPGRKLCQIVDDEPPCDVRFPALLLLPLVGQLSAAQVVPTEAVYVELTSDGDCMKLSLTGHTERDWLSEDMTRRLHHAMRAEYGDRGRWKAGGSPSLTLWLPLLPADQEELVDGRR